MADILKRERFEEMGEAAVRSALELGSFNEGNARQARGWLAELDHVRNTADREASNASNLEQIRIARSTKNAAWAAAVAAIIAGICAVIVIFIR